ncbi:hypothetical protein AeMF1_005757 [Aphanomyces euteiches]|nr:hypothetical protein AeMF1_005757 [Aphanomyces euteiches]KAH9183707.1 hypothetical protein AeNC1_014320 [Aphanomyces euteiches]
MLQRVQDLVPHIASYIEAPDDFFSFLEAVGPTDIPGKLKYIWQLGLQMDRSDLWPLLHIDTSMHIPFEALEPCMTYYSIIHIEQTENLEWLKKHLDSKTEVHWTLSDGWRTPRWIDLKLFFVTRLCIEIDSRADEKRFLDVLPELFVHLKALVLRLDYMDYLIDLEKVLALVADSKQLIELDCWKVPCRGLNFYIRDAMAHDILKWFNQQPVRVFRIKRWKFQVDEHGLRQKVFDTVFNCPTMDTFACSNCDLNGLVFTSCSFPMRSLKLSCCMDIRTFEAFVRQLAGSKLVHFKWASEYNTGTQPLFQVLPHTSIKTLEISRTKLNFSEWKLLAQFLPSCRLESLTLRNCGLINQIVISIAKAIKKNHTISELDLSSNRFEFNAARTLIKCTTVPYRFVHMKLIVLGGNIITRQQIEVLKVLAVRRCIQTLETEDESDDEESYSEDSDDSNDEDDSSEDNAESDDEANHSSSKDESCSEDYDDSDNEDDSSEDNAESDDEANHSSSKDESCSEDNDDSNDEDDSSEDNDC